MKNLLKCCLFVILMLGALTGWSRDGWPKKIKTSEKQDDILLNVLIEGEQNAASQALMNAFNKYWTSTKFEFIDLSEMKKRLPTQNYYFIYGGVTADKNNPAIGWMAFLRSGIESLFGAGYSYAGGTITINHNKKTGTDYLSYESTTVGFGVNTNLKESYPDFFVALISQMVEWRYLKKVKKRCFDGQNATPEGMLLFDGFTSDYFQGKTLLIDVATKDKMIKVFKDEATLKRIVSKTTLVPESNIFILSTDELCKSFKSGKEDILYMYTYYSYMETNQKSIGELWMAPNILNSDGKFVASLDNYKNLKKIHK